jgi:hypothetical protein
MNLDLIPILSDARFKVLKLNPASRAAFLTIRELVGPWFSKYHSAQARHSSNLVTTIISIHLSDQNILAILSVQKIIVVILLPSLVASCQTTPCPILSYPVTREC